MPAPLPAVLSLDRLAINDSRLDRSFVLFSIHSSFLFKGLIC